MRDGNSSIRSGDIGYETMGGLNERERLVEEVWRQIGNRGERNF